MRMPSVKTLSEFRNLSPADARLIRRIGRAVDDGEALRAIVDAKCPDTANYVRRMYHSPYNSHMWRVTVALHAMDVIMETHGVEAIGESSGPNSPPPFEYLNAGDPYAATLVYSRATDTVRVACWGDIEERRRR